MDYNQLGWRRGFEWVGQHLPDSTMCTTEWQCANGHIWKTRWSHMVEGRPCPRCTGCNRKVMEDYLAVAQRHGIQLASVRIPSNSNVPVSWKFPNGKKIMASYHQLEYKRRRVTDDGWEGVEYTEGGEW